MKLNLNTVLILIIGALVTFIVFKCNPDKPDVVIPDDSKHQAEIRKRDSLYALRGDTIEKIYKQQDSLIAALKKNHDKVKTGKDGIKNFTPDSRDRWNDSVLTAAGYRKVMPNVP